jgi:hypothetical protein
MVTITSIEKLEDGHEMVYGTSGHGEFKIKKINSYKLGSGFGLDSISLDDITEAIDKYKPIQVITMVKPPDPFRDELIKIIAVEVFRDAPNMVQADRILNIVDSIMEERKIGIN